MTDWHQWAQDRKRLRWWGNTIIMTIVIIGAVLLALGYGDYDYDIGKCFDRGGNIVRDLHEHKGWRCEIRHRASNPGGNE